MNVFIANPIKFWTLYFLQCYLFPFPDQVKGDYNSFYRDSLRYLGCIDLDDLTSKQKQEHAFHIGLSALLGDKVYNFGELLAHPLLESLKIACPWIVELLLAFNRGDMNKLEQLQVHQWYVWFRGYVMFVVCIIVADIT